MTEILKSFGSLQSELERAKSSLRGVDENIKRLIGRDPSELPVQRNLKRTNEERRVRVGGDNRNNRRVPHENEEPTVKRRSVFSRLAERVDDDFEAKNSFQRGVISKVIVTPKEVPSRQEALEAQSKDEKSKARNRRMFGALLGTLQKFRQEETKLKPKEEKRAIVERRIEEVEIREKAEIKKERKELFFNRKKKQAEIKMIELKMVRMREYARWEELQKPRGHFIQTRARPHIHYLPRKLNDATRTSLEQSKTDIQKMIDEKRQEVYDDLRQIEERMKRNFEPKRSKVDGEGVDIEMEVDSEPRAEDGVFEEGEIAENEVDAKEDEESVDHSKVMNVEFEVDNRNEPSAVDDENEHTERSDIRNMSETNKIDEVDDSKVIGDGEVDETERNEVQSD